MWAIPHRAGRGTGHQENPTSSGGKGVRKPQGVECRAKISLTERGVWWGCYPPYRTQVDLGTGFDTGPRAWRPSRAETHSDRSTSTGSESCCSWSTCSQTSSQVQSTHSNSSVQKIWIYGSQTGDIRFSNWDRGPQGVLTPKCGVCKSLGGCL